MGEVRQYTLSDEETEQWRAEGVTGAEVREFIKRTLSEGEPKGTKIEIRSAWGERLEVYEV